MTSNTSTEATVEATPTLNHKEDEMKENSEMDRKDSTGHTTIRRFKCPLCGGHRLGAVIQLSGIQDIIGLATDGIVLRGNMELPETDYGECSCQDCDWRGAVYDDEENCFQQHLIETTALRFTCPKCGGLELSRHRRGHTTSYPILVFYPDVAENIVQVTADAYGREDHGGQFSYGCGSCDYSLADEEGKPIADADNLIAWLQSHS